MRIEQVQNPREKREIARRILEALPDWFAIPAAREQYIRESAEQTFLAAKEQEETVGFLCLKETGKATAEIAVMGVLPDFHRRGIGRRLAQAAKETAARQGYAFLQVKTVQMGRYPAYDKTNLFYEKMGFQQFEVFPHLWDENNPCQVYVTAL